MIKKNYAVYYSYEDVAEGSKDEYCNHYFEEFDTIKEAVECFNRLKTTRKQIVRLVVWRTDITDITSTQSTEQETFREIDGAYYCTKHGHKNCIGCTEQERKQ